MEAIILTGDHHVNSTVGLCPPSFELDDGGTYKLNKTQRWLWGYWNECWQEAEEFMKGAIRTTWIVNGDALDYDSKGRSSQYVTNNKATVQRMAVTAMEPGLIFVDRLYMIRGTDAHVGNNGEMEEALAQDIDITVKNGEVASWYHLQGVMCGMRVDVAHHTNMGGLAWTEKNAANKVAADAIMQYVLAEQKIPHLVVRSHVHRHADSYDNFPTRAVVLPAWQSMTAYGARLNPNRLSDVGMIVFLIDDGKIVAEKKMITKLHQIGRSVWTNQL
jgi:hypothetical protein